MNKLLHYSVSAAIIIDSENKVLIAKRPQSKLFGNKYEFPGGKVEQNETLELTLKREIKEELNANIKIIEKFHEQDFEYPQFTVNLNFFLVHLKKPTLKCIEHQEIIWVDINELNNYDMLESNQVVIQKLIDWQKNLQNN